MIQKLHISVDATEGFECGVISVESIEKKSPYWSKHNHIESIIDSE